MAVDQATALLLMKARLNMLASNTSLDTYLTARITAAEAELENQGVEDLGFFDDDLLFVVDFAVWQYQNRDKPGGMPDWMRLKRRERWLRMKEAQDDS